MGDKIDVMSHSLRKLGIYKNLTSHNNQSTLKGKKLRKAVWDFWHSESTASTLTSRTTKLLITNKSELQSGLDFVDTVTIKKQRNKDFISVNCILLLSHLSSYFQSMLQLTLII